MQRRPMRNGSHEWGVAGPLEAFLVMFGKNIIRSVMMGRYPSDHVQLAGPCRSPGFKSAWVSLVFLFEENHVRDEDGGIGYLPVTATPKIRAKGRLHSMYTRWITCAIPAFVEDNIQELDPYCEQMIYREAQNARTVQYEAAREEIKDFTPKCVMAALEREMKDGEFCFPFYSCYIC